MLDLLKRWFGFKKAESGSTMPALPIKDLSIEEVKHAVSQFSKEKPDGVHLSVLIKDNHEIDYFLLAPYLKAIPSKAYYMSKETYEIFEDLSFAKTIDLIQKAVDQYIDLEGKFPIVDRNQEMKICYLKLNPYLKDRPTFDTYLTADENLITWKKPILH